MQLGTRSVLLCAGVLLVSCILFPLSFRPASAQSGVMVVPGREVKLGAWTGQPQVTQRGQVFQCVVERALGGGTARKGDRMSIVIGGGAGWGIQIVRSAFQLDPDKDQDVTLLIDGQRTVPADAYALDPNRFAIHPGDVPGFELALKRGRVLTVRSRSGNIDDSSLPIDGIGPAMEWVDHCGRQFSLYGAPAVDAVPRFAPPALAGSGRIGPGVTGEAVGPLALAPPAPGAKAPPPPPAPADVRSALPPSGPQGTGLAGNADPTAGALAADARGKLPAAGSPTADGGAPAGRPERVPERRIPLAAYAPPGDMTSALPPPIERGPPLPAQRSATAGMAPGGSHAAAAVVAPAIPYPSAAGGPAPAPSGAGTPGAANPGTGMPGAGTPGAATAGVGSTAIGPVETGRGDGAPLPRPSAQMAAIAPVRTPPPPLALTGPRISSPPLPKGDLIARPRRDGAAPAGTLIVNAIPNAATTEVSRPPEVSHPPEVAPPVGPVRVIQGFSFPNPNSTTTEPAALPDPAPATTATVPPPTGHPALVAGEPPPAAYTAPLPRPKPRS